MTEIEPYDGWRHLYKPEEDELSPFFGKEYDPYLCRDVIYNYYIHPQWDSFGSATLYCKLLYADYHRGLAIIELLGEWNDCLYNDIMFLKRNLVDHLIYEGINKFVLIAENVLNFHFYDTSYYEEWNEEIEDGWIAVINPMEHVYQDMLQNKLNYYMLLTDEFCRVPWRTMSPVKLEQWIEAKLFPKITQGA
ncbi:MAG: hypothetical protein KatS3mg034_0336 [Vicingaceae bacterium]|nr:MAG: hypothetical protein KatS3mg034_0336 [Vicingaceae bacterium]